MSGTSNVTQQLADQLWQAIADTRDAYPRVKNDAPTDEVVAAVLPVVAAVLRRIADEPGMGFMTGPHDVSAATRLRARADELDPPTTEED